MAGKSSSDLVHLYLKALVTASALDAASSASDAAYAPPCPAHPIPGANLLQIDPPPPCPDIANYRLPTYLG
eukprot:scaffold82599_cov33-Tisochrysis_lutea.AAC.4